MVCAAPCHEHRSGLVRFTKPLKCARSPLCKGGVNELQTIPHIAAKEAPLSTGATQPESDEGKRKAFARAEVSDFAFPFEFRARTDQWAHPKCVTLTRSGVPQSHARIPEMSTYL